MDYESYVRTDYKSVASRPTDRRRHFMRTGLLMSICSCALLGVLATTNGATTSQFQIEPRRIPPADTWQQNSIDRINLPLKLPEFKSAAIVRETLASRGESSANAQTAMVRNEKFFMDLQHDAPRDVTAAHGKWHDITVEVGDTLSSIFSRLDILRELQSVMELGPKITALDSIYPGQDLHIRIGKQGMEQLVFDPDTETRLRVARTSEGEFEAKVQELALKTRQFKVVGTIKHSLYLDGQEAGLSDLMIMKVSELFGWDIDFALDIRKGDTFAVIYEQPYRKGKELGDVHILAAEFTNQGQVYRVFRYTSSNGRTGYYTPASRSVHRPFLRTPVEIARISSPFDLYRRHPILNTIRAHRGVDYAAPTGTPIRATGDGVVVQQGTMGGYGETVTLAHGSRYTTLYGHMSGFASHTSVGEHVQQGQVIGYIGSTGLATGPHLHYEFRINGVHHDPLTINLPAAQPLPRGEMKAFLNATQPLRADLNGFARHRFAMK